MTDNTKTSSEEDFDWFNNNGIFMPMINDTGRNVAYKKAIEKWTTAGLSLQET